MIYIHVIFGGLGILCGFAAMLFAKGSRAHRLAGNFYVVSMMTMTLSAFIIAVFLRPLVVNVIAACLTFYLVTSAWMTVRRRPDNPQRLEIAAFALAVLTGFGALAAGVFAANSPGGFGRGFENMPAFLYFMFGTVALLSAWGDYRLIRRRSISRTQKLVRHLWRMGYSLWVATTSFFFGQARHLPDWFTGPHFNAIPILIVVVLLVFWLIRVRFPPWTRKTQAVPATPAPAKP
jgi:uncharacterized membrane protein